MPKQKKSITTSDLRDIKFNKWWEDNKIKLLDGFIFHEDIIKKSYKTCWDAAWMEHAK